MIFKVNCFIKKGANYPYLTLLIAATLLASSLVAKPNTYKLKMHKVIDPYVHLLAGYYLVPAGWRVKDEIKWMPLNYGTPVIGKSTITSPDGKEILLRVSALSIQYGQSTLGQSGIKPPSSIGTFLASLWAQEHPGVQYKIVAKTQTPIKTKSGQFYTYSYEGSVKLSFLQNGSPMLVKGYARIDGYQTRPIGAEMVSEGQWTISNIVGATAPEKKLRSAMKLFAICLASFHIDPHYFNLILQVQRGAMAQAYHSSENALTLSRHLAHTQSQISADIMSVYKNRSKAMDKMNENFDDYIKGLSTYTDSNGKKIKLPNWHAHLYSDGHGDYYYSDKASGVNKGYHELK